MNLVLVGFMGVGKSEVSGRVAAECDMSYLSTDKIIEERESMSISDIFKIKGEDYFRDIEKRVVKEVAVLDNTVIDGGGGLVLDYENIESLKGNGVIVCLKATPELILKRLEKDNNRPLLDVQDRLKEITEILKIREPYYNKIEHSIDTSGLSVAEVVERVKDIFKPYL
jgi:shikimate kinase